MNERLHARKYLLETIVASVDDAGEAAAGGADRLELCSALVVGGLTPTLGTLRSIKQAIDLPVMCMVRPREGGMDYSAAEFATMLVDAELALESGADGLVFGFLDSGGAIETSRNWIYSGVGISSK
ncbi:MAG: copper homeostasis protein CutC [Acidobacteriota bacterium]